MRNITSTQGRNTGCLTIKDNENSKIVTKFSFSLKLFDIHKLETN